MVYRERIGDIARVVELLGDKWTPLLLRELINNGPLRFSDIAGMFPGLSERTLSARLKRLYEADVLVKLPYSTQPLRYRYGLDPKRQELVAVLREMASASRHLS